MSQNLKKQVPSIKILKSDVSPNTPTSHFFSFLSLILVSSLVSRLPLLCYGYLYTLLKIHEIDCSRTFLPYMQNEHSQNAKEASINLYRYIRLLTTMNELSLRPGLWIDYTNT